MIEDGGTFDTITMENGWFCEKNPVVWDAGCLARSSLTVFSNALNRNGRDNDEKLQNNEFNEMKR